MNTTPVHDPFFDTDTSPSGWNGQPMDLIPPRFQELGTLSFLGRGAVGSVFRIRGDEDLALKVIPCGTDEGRFQSARNELNILSMLRGDSHIVRLRDCEITETGGERTVCLLEDYHESLPAYLSDADLRVSDALRLMLGLCDALLACRKAGVLHLDIQPKNIFVDAPDAVKLGDFGSALTVADARSNPDRRGTLAFMAPEVYRDGNCSERSELYAAGLVLYYLFHKQVLPFMDTEQEKTALYKRLAGDPFPPLSLADDSLGRQLDEILGKACAFRVEERYADLEAFRSDLSALLARVLASPAADERLYPAVPTEGSPFPEPTCASFSAADSAPDSLFDTAAVIPDDMFGSDPCSDSAPFCAPHCAPSAMFDTIDDFSDLSDTAPLPSDDLFDTAVGAPGVLLHDAPPALTRPASVERPRKSSVVRPRKVSPSGLRSCRFCHKQFPEGAWFCPFCGHEILSDAPEEVDIRKVEFSAVAPRTLVKGDYSLIHVVMYEEAFRRKVDSLVRDMGKPAQVASSGTHKVKAGSAVTVVLQSPDIPLDDNTGTGVWEGEYLDFPFSVCLPEDYRKRQVLFTASVYINDVIASKLKFIVNCASLFKQRIAVEHEDVLSAFVSYASEDRQLVAAVIMGMKKARPDMDLFFDVDSLRSGEAWEPAIFDEIDKRDMLFLCWSHFARESKWVEKEWRHALEQKGAEGIEPIPVELPICPPPEELGHKHFNDKYLYIINAAKASPRQEPRPAADPARDTKW